MSKLAVGLLVVIAILLFLVVIKPTATQTATVPSQPVASPSAPAPATPQHETGEQVVPVPPAPKQAPAKGQQKPAPATGKNQPSARFFFPHQEGDTWTYNIRLGTKPPLYVRNVVWDRVQYTNRGRYTGMLRNRKAPNSPYVLQLQVKGRALTQGPLEYRDGVELRVLKDDLFLYENVARVFWAIGDDEESIVHEVVTYSPFGRGAPSGFIGSGEGFSLRLAFFLNRPGISIGIGKEPVEKLAFLGVDSSLRLHFLRHAEAKEPDPGETADAIDSAYQEDMYYEPNRGLVELVQRVDGELSMQWVLADFHPGAAMSRTVIQ